MQEHIDPGRLHDLIDGLLDDAQRERVEAHLRACRHCANAFAGIAEGVTALEALPKRATPDRDLWPEIRARMDATGRIAEDQEDGVIPFPAERAPAGSAQRATRRISFSVPQLVAAGVALALMSGGVVWLGLSGGAPAGPAPGPGVAAVGAESAIRPASAELDQAVLDLEAALDAGRELLDEETLRVLDESLATIDAAIDDARRALVADPASETLQRLLVNNQRTKLRVLRAATTNLLRT